METRVLTGDVTRPAQCQHCLVFNVAETESDDELRPPQHIIGLIQRQAPHTDLGYMEIWNQKVCY